MNTGFSKVKAHYRWSQGGEGKLCELQRPGKSKIQKTNFILTNLNCRLSIKYDSIKSFNRWNKKILSFLKKQHCS